MNSVPGIIALVLISLIVYILAVLWLKKWMVKQQVPCFWRSLILALLLAPGLMLYGEHAGFPLPSFAWMSGANSAYSCIQSTPLCSVKLIMFLSVLPFIATWIFAYVMCQGAEKK